MKITISFTAKTPRQAVMALRAAKATIQFEFNPGQWKRPGVLDLTADIHSTDSTPVKIVMEEA